MKDDAPMWTADALQGFAIRLLSAAGMDSAMATTVAELLVEADLLGHDTHGLALAPRYLEELANGSMTTHGAAQTLHDTGACVTWDGRRLPGIWLVSQALDLALDRAPTHGCVTVVIRNSHHIGCLAAYLARAAERGCIMILACSDPSQASVAPFGGTQAVFTPNPMAMGFPTGGDPVLIDTSASITTNNMAARLAREGRRYTSPVLLSADGKVSDDPSVLKAGGTLLPAGGLDHGQKGYGWALMVEALTQRLSGFGRADHPSGWGASVFLQILDPAAFGGQPAFVRQTEALAQRCRANTPRPGVDRVRLPGQAGLMRKRLAEQRGLALCPAVMNGLKVWAGKLHVLLPKPLPGA